MSTKIENFVKNQLKTDLPDIWPGDTIKVYQRTPVSIGASSSDKSSAGKKEKRGEKAQVFEGLVIAKKHGKGITSTITVRKEVLGVGVERIFPLHSPTIEKIEVIKKGKARRAKLYYLRGVKGKKAKLKQAEAITR